MQILAIDEAWAKESPAAVKAAGYTGVIGYLSHDTTKCLTTDQIGAYQAQGLGVAFVFEDTAGRALAGFTAGVADGEFANAQADTLGVPATLPLYAAVDFNANATQMPSVVAYIQGFGSVKRPGRGYGSLATVNALFAAGIGDGWQTEAWSGSTVSGHAAIYQRVKPTTILTGSFDEDVLLTSPAEAGFWLPSGAPAPAPVVPVTPTPQPAAPTPAPILRTGNGVYIFRVTDGPNANEEIYDYGFGPVHIQGDEAAALGAAGVKVISISGSIYTRRFSGV